MSLLRACAVRDVGEGEVIGVVVSGHKVAIYNDGGEFFATADVCSHEYALLSDGWFEEGRIECPKHGSQFDIRTGRPLSLPAITPLDTIPVTVEGEDVLIELNS